MQPNSSSLALGSAHFATDSREIQERLEVRRIAAPQTAPAGGDAPQDGVEILDPKLLLAKWLYKYFTGHDMPLARARQSGVRSAAASQVPEAASSWGVSYTRREVHRQTESSSFAAQGSVVLASGRKIEFSLSLQMNRELTEIDGVAFRAGNMSDPIALNLDGAGVRLNGTRQAFDLDGDGLDEAIATLAEGSAWLARDANGNGTVDSGKELFGPRSGNGFGELRALDQDADGWITEGDAAYEQLGVWSGGALTSLRDAGIGALSVASVSTPFSLTDGAELLGRVRASGVYLREDGSPGALQQVDLEV